VAHALFADGAAAMVLGPGPAGSDRPSGWRVRSTASRLLSDAPDAMTWCIGDHGFEMTLSPMVPALIGGHLRPWLDRWLEENGLAVDDVASWAIHPGGPRVLDAATAVLELPDDACAVSRAVLAECGNMSSPTVGFLVERLLRADAPTPCVALAFGPGLVAEAALFEQG
jgi:predicted naringenin-chalcone synthase